MNFTLKVWRQRDAKSKGHFETYQVKDISEGTSFLEMMDILNEQLIREKIDPVKFDAGCHGKQSGPVSFDHDCREGICGGFPVIKDLVVDRGAYDKILQAGGFISVNTGGVPDANAIPIPKKNADESMDAASCVGCGACAATCKNGSAMLFVAARVSSLALLPQGKIEGARRAKAMVAKMDELGFGACTNTRACEMECPKHITVSHIARLNREFLKAKFKD